MRYVGEVLAALEQDGDPRFAAMDDGEVEAAVRGGAAEIAAATCRWLQALAELVRRGIWSEQGARTPAQWLSWAVSMGPSTAREHVRVALRLRDYPRVEAAFAAGEISYTKVRAITRCERPELEEMLLTYCRYATGSQIETIVAGLRRSDRDEGSIDPHDARSVSWRWRDDGMMEARIVLPTDVGEGLRQRIERRVDQLAEEHRRTAPAEAPPGDVEVTHHGSDNAPAEAPPGEAEVAPPGPDTASAEAPPPSRPALAADAFVEAVTEMSEELPSSDVGGTEVVIHLPAEALERPDPNRERRVPVRGRDRRIPAMPLRMARRLACDASLRLVGHDQDGREVAASRRRRRPTPAMRRRLVERDRRCRFPGCDVRRGLHAHHIVHWADGGGTTMANLVLLCAHHHRFVHERGWRIHHDGEGRLRFERPDRTVVPPVAPMRLPTLSETERDGEEGSPARDGLQARWDGHPPDLDLAVALLHEEIQRQQAPERAAVAA